MKLKIILFTGALVAVFFAAPVCAQSLQRVRIAYASSGLNYADLFLAKDKGFFREEGIEPQLIQMSSNIAITATMAGEIDGQASVGSALRAMQRGAPLRVVTVTLRRPLYWLVVRSELRSIKELKGKTAAVSSVGGSQQLRAKGMLAAGGLDPDKDVTYVQISDQATQLQALVSNSVQITALSPPWVAVARDKFKMNVLDSALERFAGVDSGLAVPIKFLQENRELLKRILRARARGNRLYLDNEQEAVDLVARLYRVDQKTALDSVRAARPAFTTNGIPRDEEIKEHLAVDAQMLKLPKPASPAELFDFSVQREVIRELGLK
jgi:ABC-type nitrate/sulfonate/bicarbonate transport system substrate-binding protein